MSPKLPHEPWLGASCLTVDAFGDTDRGYVRPRNEDSFGIRSDLGLYMVADGVSGREAGDLASRMAVDLVGSFVERVHDTWPRTPRDGQDPTAALFAASLRHANRRVHREGRVLHGEGRGMTTTFVGALCMGDKVCIGHVGDSRAYRFRDGEVLQLTEDHSLANEVGRSPRAEEWLFAGVNPAALTRAIGLFESVEPTVRVEHAQPGDIFLLCSDGLTNMLDVTEIAGLLTHVTDLELCARAMIIAANTAGGIDNTTVVLVRFREEHAD